MWRSGGICQTCRRRVERSFVTGRPIKRWAKLRAHIESCAPCRRHFDRLGYAGQPLAPNSSLPGDGIERVASALFADRSLQPKTGARIFLWAGLPVAAAACAAVLWFTNGATHTEEHLTARGAVWPADLRPPGVRVFCVDKDDGETGGMRVFAQAQAVRSPLPLPTLSCNVVSGHIQISYSTPKRKGLTMVVLSRDASEAAHYYVPSRADQPALLLKSDAVDEVVGHSTSLAVNHRPGRYVVDVLFFDAPVPAEQAARGQVSPIEHLQLVLDVRRAP